MTKPAFKAPVLFPAGALIPPRPHVTLAEKVVRALVLTLAFAGVLAAVWLLRFLIVPCVVAMVLTIVVGPLVDRLENRGLSRKGAVTACFSALLGTLALGALALWPTVESWLKETPKTGERSVFEVQLESRIDSWQTSLASTYHQVDWVSLFDKLRAFLQHQRQSLVEQLPAMLLEAASHSGVVILALIITAFVLLDGWAMKKGLVAFVPNRHFENALQMLSRVEGQIASYLIGTAAESGIVTVMLVIPLWLLGMPNAFLFAVIFGIANVIPFAGPFIGASAGLFFCLLDPNAPSMGALVAVYLVVHFIDAGVINPLVMGKSLDMHPLTVIVGIAVGGHIGGVIGMLVIIPLIAVVKAIVTTVAEGLRNASTV